MADQFFWAWRLRQLGVATAAVPHRKLTVRTLAAAMRRALDDSEMRPRARLLGERIRAECGLVRAVNSIEKYISRVEQKPIRAGFSCPKPRW
jgi:sterol 3beta-glucosyltransferase